MVALAFSLLGEDFDDVAGWLSVTNKYSYVQFGFEFKRSCYGLLLEVSSMVLDFHS